MLRLHGGASALATYIFAMLSRVPLYQVASSPLLVAGGWWLLEQIVPDLLPDLPKAIGLSIATIAAAAVVLGLVVRFFGHLEARHPWPWLPRQPWRVSWWLRHRPVFAIVQAVPRAVFDGAVVTEFTWRLIIAESFHRTPVPMSVDYSHARLVLRQRHGGRWKDVEFRPVQDTIRQSDELSRPPRSQQSLMLQFEGVRPAIPVSEAINHLKDYEILLSGVRVRALRGLRTEAELPPMRWHWSAEAHRQNLSYMPELRI
jgi:hypothetical protein